MLSLSTPPHEPTRISYMSQHGEAHAKFDKRIFCALFVQYPTLLAINAAKGSRLIAPFHVKARITMHTADKIAIHPFHLTHAYLSYHINSPFRNRMTIRFRQPLKAFNRKKLQAKQGAA